MLKSVFIFPYSTNGNPYQLITKNSLEALGIKTYTIVNKDIFPLLKVKSSNWIIFDWLSPYCISSNGVKSLIKTCLFIFQLLLLKKNKINIFWNIHNLHDHEKRSSIIDKCLHLFMIKNATVCRFFSESGKALFEEYYSKNIGIKNSVVISHPSYHLYYKNEDLTFKKPFNKFGLNAKKDYFLFMGNYRPYKGIGKFLQNFPYQKLGSDQLFLLASKLKKHEKLKFSNNKKLVIIDHFIDENELASLFACVKVVILPYSYILTSGMLFMCMSYKKPVIVPCLPFFEEVLGNTYPLLYRDQDECVSLINKINKYDLNQLGEDLFNKCTKEYNPNSINKKIITCMEEYDLKI